jgi:hypothetical protein
MRKVVRIPPNKAGYVKEADFTPGHTCHWPGCKKEVKPAMWGCAQHWFKLPAHLRNRIWMTYKPGQEISKTPSLEYLTAAKEVQEWIERNAKPV